MLHRDGDDKSSRYLNVILNGYNFAYNIIKIKPRGVLAIDQWYNRIILKIIIL